jgi:hypothetical protein
MVTELQVFVRVEKRVANVCYNLKNLVGTSLLAAGREDVSPVQYATYKHLSPR